MVKLLSALVTFSLVIISECFFLRPRGPLLVLGISALLLMTLLFVCSWLGKKKKIFLSIADALCAIGIVSCLGLTGAIAALSPQSSWYWWQKALLSGEVRGGISMAIVLVSGAVGLASIRFVIKKKYLQALLIFLIPGLFVSGLALSLPLLGLSGMLLFLLAVGWRILRSAGNLPEFPKIFIRLSMLAIIPLLIGLWIMAGPKGFALVDTLVENGFKQWVIKTIPSLPSALAIPSWGSGKEGARIDHVPVLSSETVFTAWASPQTNWYLKIHEYESLEGSVWENSKYRKIKSNNTGKNNNTSAFPEKSVTVRQTFPPGVIPRLNLRVEADYFPGIPRTQNTDFVVITGKDPGEQFDGEIFSGFEEIQYEPIFPWKTRMQILSAGAQSTTELDPELGYINDCLKIPPEYKPTIEKFMMNFQKIPNNNEDYVKFLVKYFQNNYQYSLESAEFGTDTSAMDQFLFNRKKGWCSHFASALTLLCRLRGISARYVQGYTVNFGPKESQSQIPGTAAHAWTEVWLSDKGWVIFDATPGYNAQNGSTLSNPVFMQKPKISSPISYDSKFEFDVQKIVVPVFSVMIISSAILIFLFAKNTEKRKINKWNKLVYSLNKASKSDYKISQAGLNNWIKHVSNQYPQFKDIINKLAETAKLIAWKGKYPEKNDLIAAKKVLKILKSHKSKIIK